MQKSLFHIIFCFIFKGLLIKSNNYIYYNLKINNITPNLKILSTMIKINLKYL